MDYINTWYVNIEKIAENLWLIVIYVDNLWDNWTITSNEYISINNILDDFDKRSTIGHELWHFIYWHLDRKSNHNESMANDFC